MTRDNLADALEAERLRPTPKPPPTPAGPTREWMRLAEPIPTDDGDNP